MKKKGKKKKAINKKFIKSKKTKKVKKDMQSKVKYNLKEKSDNFSQISEQEIKNLDEEIKYIKMEINEEIDID